MTTYREMRDFVAHRTDPETTERIVRELDVAGSYASLFVEEMSLGAERLSDLIDWQRVCLHGLLDPAERPDASREQKE
jgi:hypothetical protein